MTPTELNKRIRAGEFFWVETEATAASILCRERQALKARTVTSQVKEDAFVASGREDALPGDKVKIQVRTPGTRRVQVKTDIGWHYAIRVRPAGGDWVLLSGEGRMDGVLN